MTHTNTGPIVVAVADPALHSEAIHIAAATGRKVIDAADDTQLARHAPKAHALLIDDLRAPSLHPQPRGPNVFTVVADTAPAATREDVFALPAQATDVLRSIGALALAPAAHTARGKVVAVLGACGGSGASVFSAALCRVAGDATLIDAHQFSGGLDLLLGLEATPGARWGDIDVTAGGAVSRAEMRGALPATEDDTALLTFPRTTVADPFRLSPEELNAVVHAAGTEGLTAVDTPLALLPDRCDLAVVVLRPELRAAAAAARIVAECNAAGVANALLLRQSSWASLEPAQVEDTAKASVIAQVQQVRGLTKQLDQTGLPAKLPRTLARAAEAVLGEVA
ncbi:septum site-determining protein Ssd [Corynebacterium afermentans]|uniref:septum site-determining protein Ssd n=1 Tax=Corynebacterium afermentans TaxID=38286 RepID=UPI002572638C|nr:septum site-determining protein Ssd [Corynebacterium afermentans]